MTHSRKPTPYSPPTKKDMQKQREANRRVPEPMRPDSAKCPKRVAAGKRANRKGKVGQTEAKNYLIKLGFDGVNSASHGVTGGVDVYARDLPNVAIEVKYHCATMDIHTACLRKAWEQAAGVIYEGDDGEGNEIWSDNGYAAVVLWRPLRKPWRLTWMGPCGLVTTTGDDAIKSQLLRLNGGKDK